MSRSRRLLGGLAMGYGYQAILVLAGLWLTPFLLSRIGQHDYGLWLVGTQLLTYLALTDFGVVALLPMEVAYATGRAGGSDQSHELPALVGQTLRLVLYQTPIVLALALAIWFALPSQYDALRGPLAVILVGFVISFPLRILPALLHGLQDLAFTGRFQIWAWTLSTLATVAMVMAGWSLFALAVGWVITQTILAPVFIYRLKTKFPGVLPRSIPPLAWKATRTQLGKGFWINVAQIAQLLMNNIDLLILARLLGPAAVVPYACTGKLPLVLANQAHILMQNATPGLCELKTGESRRKLLDVLIALTHGILAFSGLVFCVVLVVNRWFVDWWVTANQYGGFALTVAFLVTITTRHWNTTTAYTVFCLGHQRRISLTNLCDGLVSAAACVFLTGIAGPVGTALGSLAGAVVVSLPCNLRVIARDTKVSVLHLMSAMLSGWFSRFALVAGAALWVGYQWPPASLQSAVYVAVLTGCVYVLVMLPVILRSPLGSYLRSGFAAFRSRCAAFHARAFAFARSR